MSAKSRSSVPFDEVKIMSPRSSSSALLGGSNRMSANSSSCGLSVDSSRISLKSNSSCGNTIELPMGKRAIWSSQQMSSGDDMILTSAKSRSSPAVCPKNTDSTSISIAEDRVPNCDITVRGAKVRYW